MSFKKDGLADYQEVPDRIRAFKEEYPDGSLVRDEWHTETIGDQTFIVYTALAFRKPQDIRPGVGTAWEPFPGKTSFTKDSELMNAETSAWGRALVAIGFVAKKIASKEEVQGRQSNGREGSDVPSEKQVQLIATLAKKHGADDQDTEIIKAFVAVNLTGGKTGTASKTIDLLQGESPGPVLARLAGKAAEWHGKAYQDVAPDMEGLVAS